LDDEEIYIGTRCAGAPIFDSAGRVIAAIGITAPAMRFTRERIPEITNIVKMVAAEFSSRFQTNR
jgi:IclR family acetate operon transcriptional repressor